MARFGNAIAGLGAIASGYVMGDRMLKKEQMDEEDRRLRKEEADLRLAAARREAANQQALADAGRSAVVEPNITNDDNGEASSAPALRMVGPGPVQNFNDPGTANAAAAAVNDPNALHARQVAVLNSQGKPVEAMSLQANKMALDNANWQQQRQRTVAGREDTAYARKLIHEGAADTARAMLTGDPNQVFSAFNASGDIKLKAPPSVKVVGEIDVPNLGKKNIYEYTGTVIGPDGKETTVTHNSHQFNMAILPYKEQMDAIDKATKTATEEARWKADRDYKAATLPSEIDKNRADADYRLSLADYYKSGGKSSASGASGGDKPYRMDEDDRLRFRESSQSVRDAERAVSDALKEGSSDPAKNPAWAAANDNLKRARLGHFKLSMQLGMITPEQAGEDIMSVAKNSQDVMKSLNELASTVGPGIADKVAASLTRNSAYQQLVDAEKKRQKAESKPAPTLESVKKEKFTTDPTPYGGRGAPPSADSGPSLGQIRSPLVVTPTADRNYPGGRISLNLPSFPVAPPAPVLDPSAYDANFRRNRP